jgi:hypothetical protein
MAGVRPSGVVNTPTSGSIDRETTRGAGYDRSRWRWSVTLGDGLFVAGLALLLIYAAWLGRHLSFFSDDWDIIAFHSNGNYLTPFNGHLLLLPIAIYHTLFVAVGLGTYTPYRIVGLVSYGIFGVALFAYLRQRVAPLYAALGGLWIVWFSAGQLNVMFPLLLDFSLPLAATVGIWILLDRRTARCDLLAGLCLAVALACSGVGLTAVVAVGTELLIQRAPPRRWIPFVPPFVIWVLWYVRYHTPVASPGTLGDLVLYVLHEIQATFAGFAAGWNPGGYMLLAGTILVFALAVTRWRTLNGRAAGALVAIIAFAGLTAYTRANFVPPVPPSTPRYLWVNGFFLVVALAEVLRGRRLPSVVAVTTAAVVVIGAVTLMGNLRDYNASLAQYKRATLTFMVATQAIPNRINRHRVMPLSLVVVRTGDFLTAVRHLGSPLGHVRLQDLGSERDRTTADGWMIHDLGLRLAPASPEGAMRCNAVPGTTSLDVTVRGRTTLLVHAGPDRALVSLRRLARRLAAPIGQVTPDTSETLVIPADHSSLPWHVRIAGYGASVSTCP